MYFSFYEFAVYRGTHVSIWVNNILCQVQLDYNLHKEPPTFVSFEPAFSQCLLPLHSYIAQDSEKSLYSFSKPFILQAFVFIFPLCYKQLLFQTDEALSIQLFIVWKVFRAFFNLLLSELFFILLKSLLRFSFVCFFCVCAFFKGRGLTQHSVLEIQAQISSVHCHNSVPFIFLFIDPYGALSNPNDCNISRYSYRWQLLALSLGFCMGTWNFLVPADTQALLCVNVYSLLLLIVYHSPSLILQLQQTLKMRANFVLSTVFVI